jgi:hypothetical protein
VCLLASAPPAAGQTVPDCAPDKTLDVTFTTSERGEDAPLVATHVIAASPQFTGNTARETFTLPPDVRVVAGGKGSGGVIFVVPVAPSVPVTVAWHQGSDPSDPASDPSDPATRCAASRVVTLPIVAARPSRVVYLRLRGLAESGFTDLAVLPAPKQPDLSPVEISARTTSAVRFPPASAKPRTMAVPLRTEDQIRYPTRLPGLAGLSVAKQCRFYYLTCATPFAPGGVFTQISALEYETYQRGIRKGDVNGPQRFLARTQPSRQAARYGVGIGARPGAVRLGKPRPFGYDVQVRQSGRLIARARMAGRCVERRDSRGIFTDCKIARRSEKLR